MSVSAALIKLGNLTEAAQHLNRAEQISPESKDVYNHYGLLVEKKGRHLRSLPIAITVTLNHQGR